MTEQVERWTIEICAECKRMSASPGEPHKHGCLTGINRTVEVVPASALEAAEKREERLEAKCRKRARIITDLEARARELEEGQLIQVTALHKAKAERDEALTALRELVEAVDGTAAGLWPEIRPALREARSLLDSTEERCGGSGRRVRRLEKLPGAVEGFPVSEPCPGCPECQPTEESKVKDIAADELPEGGRSLFPKQITECGKPTVQAGTDGFCTRPRGHEGPCITV